MSQLNVAVIRQKCYLLVLVDTLDRNTGRGFGSYELRTNQMRQAAEALPLQMVVVSAHTVTGVPEW